MILIRLLHRARTLLTFCSNLWREHSFDLSSPLGKPEKQIPDPSLRSVSRSGCILASKTEFSDWLTRPIYRKPHIRQEPESEFIVC